MKTLVTATALVALGALSAQAATINISDFSAASYGAATGAWATSVVEDFEGFSEGNVADGFSTAVGTFESAGGTGSGGTVNDSVAKGNFAGNNGALLAVRDGNVYGRQSTTSLLTSDAGDDSFLDSNDTFGIQWNVSLGGGAFDRIVLSVMDAADVGATFNVTVGTVTQSVTALGNGAAKLIEIMFDSSVTTASVLFSTTNGSGDLRRNDGFSIDDLTVGSLVSGESLTPVPLPAGMWLMLSGLGGLAALRRRKHRLA